MATQVRPLDDRPVRRPRPSAATRSAALWRQYRAVLYVTDLAVVVLAALIAYEVAWDGARPHGADARRALVLLVPFAWCLCLVAFRAYEPRYLGLGGEEFTRVLRAAMVCVASVATLSWAIDLDSARGFVVIALPASTLMTLASRALLRRWLHAQRSRTAHRQRVLLVGRRPELETTVRRLQTATHHGLEVTGLCVPGGLLPGEPSSVAGIPVVGAPGDVEELVRTHDVEVVALLPLPELDGAAIRRLGWALEALGAELYVAPPLTETAGRRIVIRPVAGLALLHVGHAELSGVRRVAKGVVDRVGAALGLVALSPLLLAIAVLVASDSRGPVLFRQARVGRGGVTFSMLKFRSMVCDAEGLLIDLRDRHDGNDVLFKMRDDPRVTRVGKLLRRWSLDELPQLLNVLVGQMSLVGPRPPLAAEVALYGHEAQRRLLVKPGITGLWQVSGRSDLDWDESVRLDVSYVENWSFGSDFEILCSTVGAVLARRGAY